MYFDKSKLCTFDSVTADPYSHFGFQLTTRDVNECLPKIQDSAYSGLREGTNKFVELNPICFLHSHGHAEHNTGFPEE